MRRRKTILSLMLILVMALSIYVFASAKSEVPCNPGQFKHQGWWNRIDEYWVPDLVLFNGKILTMDKTYDVGTIAGAVAIIDDKIVAVGHTRDIMRLIGRHTKVVDLHGKTVVPGLIDSHIHMSSFISAPYSTHLITARSIADVLKLLKAVVDITPPGEWVQAISRWSEQQLAEKRLPTKAELDSIAPNNPVYVPRDRGKEAGVPHIAVVNTLGLKLTGVTKDTPDPPKGHIEKDPVTGEPTGMFWDTAIRLITKVFPQPTYEQQKQLMIEGHKKCNKVGLTAVQDPGISASFSKMYQELQAEGKLNLVRTSAMIRPVSTTVAATLADLNNISTYYYQGFGNDWYKIDSIKLGLDGGIEAGYLREPYLIVPGEQDDPNYRGIIKYTAAELAQISLECAKKGWRVGVHTVGDSAADTLLGAWEAVDAQIPIKDKRWTLIHGIVSAPDQYTRIKNLGLCITSQDQMYSHGGIVGVLWWGLDRAAAASPHRDWIDAGLMVGGGTDYSVAPYDPWQSIYWMVSRVTATYGLLGPEQAISREEALWMYTMGSAYTMGWEDKVGSIEPGKLADLVVLDKNYLHCKVDDIQNMAGNVVMTIAGGKIVYEAP